MDVTLYSNTGNSLDLSAAVSHNSCAEAKAFLRDARLPDLTSFPAAYGLTLPNLFALIETIYLKIWVKPVLNNAKTIRSVGVRLLKTPLL